MRRGSLGLAALALAVGLAVAGRAVADDAGPAAPPRPAPSAPVPAEPAAPAPAKDAAAGAPKSTTAEDLEKRLLEKPGAAAAMVALKYGPALVGLVLFVLLLVRWGDERRGLVAPPLPPSVPPRAFGVVAAVSLALVAVMGGPVVGESIHLARFGSGPAAPPIPLVWRIGATAASTILVALVTAFALRRAWARRRAGGATAAAEAVFGEGTARAGPGGAASPAFHALPTAAWPFAAASRAGIVGFFVASLFVIVVSWLTILAMMWLGAPAEPQGLVLLVVSSKSAFEPWLIAGFGVLVAPITEEYVFRGLLYPAFRDGSSALVGALVSSVIFAVIHTSWTAGPALFVLAFLLCRLYERTGSVWPGVLVHALNNATSLVPLLLLRYA